MVAKPTGGTKKLDMPIFDGIDPDGWILRVQYYFEFYHLIEAEMLEAIMLAMEGDALRWFQLENKLHHIRRWVDLKVFLLPQFRPISGGSLYEQWLATTQTSTISEYRRNFIEIASPFERIFEDMPLGHFIKGLNDDIKVEVRFFNLLNMLWNKHCRSKRNTESHSLRNLVGQSLKLSVTSIQ